MSKFKIVVHSTQCLFFGDCAVGAGLGGTISRDSYHFPKTVKGTKILNDSEATTKNEDLLIPDAN
jgi:hypothetical protein